MTVVSEPVVPVMAPVDALSELATAVGVQVLASHTVLSLLGVYPASQVATTWSLSVVHVTVAALVIPLVQTAMTPLAAIQFSSTAMQQESVSAALHVAPAQLFVPVLACFQYIIKSCGNVKENSRRKRKKK